MAVQPAKAQSYQVYLPLVIKPLPLKGLAATYDVTASLGWCHDWTTDPDCGPVSFPTVWGKSSVDKPLGGTVKTAILFNEPDWQSNINPVEGAQLTCLLIDKHPGYEFTTPSASISWLNEWWAALDCDTSRITWVNHHCYGAWNAEAAVLKCKAAYQDYKAWGDERNIPKHIVTEFAHLPCWDEGIEGTLAFLQEMKQFYEENGVLYAWFQHSYAGDESWAFGPNCNTSLVDFETGELTPIGVLYMEE